MWTWHWVTALYWALSRWWALVKLCSCSSQTWLLSSHDQAQEQVLTDSKVRGRRSGETPQVEQKEADSYCLSQVSACSHCQKQDPGVVDLGPLWLKQRCWHKERHHIMSGRKGVVWWQSAMDGQNVHCGEKWEEREAGGGISGVIQRLGEEWRDNETKEVTNLSKASSVSSLLWLGCSSTSIWRRILPQSLFSLCSFYSNTGNYTNAPGTCWVRDAMQSLLRARKANRQLSSEAQLLMWLRALAATVKPGRVWDLPDCFVCLMLT